MAILAIDHATVFDDPFPHLELCPAFEDASFNAVLALLPGPESFEVRGEGRKLELDVIETTETFAALNTAQRQNLLDLRQWIRNAAPAIIDRFMDPLREKYIWLLGEPIASEVMAAGWTTTNGRVMGRGPGYALKPHTDSAHFGVTCLLYLTDALSREDGGLALYRPARVPEVRDASTYYPVKAEGIDVALVKTIHVRRNLFVAFVAGPTSVHGFERPSSSSLAWRFVYQCHIVPRGLNMREMVFRLSDPHRARWARYLTPSPGAAGVVRKTGF